MSHRIITINRMYGSGGRLLGKALANKLGIHFYDHELIRLASKERHSLRGIIKGRRKESQPMETSNQRTDADAATVSFSSYE